MKNPAGGGVAATSAVESPSARGRHLVIAGLFLLSLVTYIDRAAISSAKGPMSTDLGLSDQAMGTVFSAFALGYALAQVPAGWVADRFGPRLALSVLVALWSVLTALTGAVSRFGPLLVIRFFFGVAEAVSFPGSAKAFYNWLPARERGLANGILFSGGMLGGALAFPLYAWLLEDYGWRSAFYLLAAPGLVWSLLWFLCFRDHPHGGTAQARISPSGQRGVLSILRSWRMVLTMAQYFAGNFTFFVGVSWMHPYLKQRYDLTAAEAAGYAMIPLLCGAGANWISGIAVDALYRCGVRAWSRRVPAMAGFVLAACGVIAVPLVSTPAAAVAGFAAAVLGVELTISPSWSYCMDVGGRNSGSISGAMNMVGNFGAFVSANAFPFFYGLTGGPGAYFSVAALLNVGGMACWMFMMPPARPE
jgi:ACS family glucarate transporter-like MFS transporter